MLKEAIEKIEELAKPLILDKEGHTYAVRNDGVAQEIIPEMVYQDCLALNSLDALVQMVRTAALPHLPRGGTTGGPVPDPH